MLDDLASDALRRDGLELLGGGLLMGLGLTLSPLKVCEGEKVAGERAWCPSEDWDDPSWASPEPSC